MTLGSSPAQWTASEWEGAWAPYDDATYDAVLALLEPNDVVLDIGAGDLRFARRAAALVRAVIAVEQRGELLIHPLPPNLTVLTGDARLIPFPPGVTAGVLLMRHCLHLREYLDKLRAIGCRRLITNARWGMGIEVIDLYQPREPLGEGQVGWYACLCGATGFTAPSAQVVDRAALDRVIQVSSCPKCRNV